MVSSRLAADVALLTLVSLGLVAGPTRAARAEEPPLDVVPEARPVDRALAIEWNPLSLVFLSKLSFNLVIVPVDHHALVLSPFYASTTTAPVYVYDDRGDATALPEQTFRGFGAELGYRYYVGKGGPRGLFLGPSVLVGSFRATAANGERTPYLDLGVAADLGYQALVADRVSLTLGAGVQYTTPDRSLPDQQFPAQVFANRLVRPRALLSFGWAF